MSKINQDYDDHNEDSQNYDGDDNQDQDQDEDEECDYSQDNNFQNNEIIDCDADDDDGDEGDNNGDGGNNGNDGNDDNDGNDGNDNDNGDDDDDDDDENGDGFKYIRLRGLPWSATHKEILDFLENINVVGGADGIHIVTRRWDGVNSGEAYVVLKSPQDVAAAMKLDNHTMGHRYIEVFNATAREAKYAMRKTGSHGSSYVVKLRGLPFSITEQQVETFFSGLEIKPDREGIIFVMDRRGRATGEAYVQFETQEDTEQALERNRQKIGHRYIEIFRSSMAELKRYTNGNGRMAPYDLKDRGSNRGGIGNDFGGGNNRNNRWGGNGGFGVGANNTLGFNNLPLFGNNGNFGNNGGGNFGNFDNNGGGGGMGNFGNFGNNNGGNFGNFGNNNGGNNFGNNSGGGNNGNGGGFNRFSGNSGNFGNDFGDFGNFGNNRGNSGMGGGGQNSNGSGNGGFNNFSSFGGNNMGGGGGFGNNMGGGFGNNMSGMGGNTGGGGGAGNFGPIGGGRNDEYYMIMMRGLPFSSFENDVYKFFEPLRPVNARIHYNKQNGRHNGTAEVLFDDYDDAQLAMKRHRCKMGARYIELFFNGKKSIKGGNNYSTGGSMSSIGNSGNSIGMGGGMGSGAFSRRI